jgi:hypothetical protein
MSSNLKKLIKTVLKEMDADIPTNDGRRVREIILIIVHGLRNLNWHGDSFFIPKGSNRETFQKVTVSADPKAVDNALSNQGDTFYALFTVIDETKFEFRVGIQHGEGTMRSYTAAASGVVQIKQHGIPKPTEIIRWAADISDQVVHASRSRMNEVSKKDLKMRHPNNPEFYDKVHGWDVSKLTLDNLVSLQRKCGNMIKAWKDDPDERFRAWAKMEQEQYEELTWEIRDRLAAINKSPIKEFSGGIGICHNQLYAATNCSGYSHGATADPYALTSTRDPLNDPILTGKLDESVYKHFNIVWNQQGVSKGAGKIMLDDKIWFANTLQINSDWDRKHAGMWILNKHQGAFDLNFASDKFFFDSPEAILEHLEDWYKLVKMAAHSNHYPLKEKAMGSDGPHFEFDEFDWLSSANGFDKPIDVYNNTVLLGVITSKPDGYVISAVMGIDGKAHAINPSDNNKYKTKENAAEVLYKTWQIWRHGSQR